MENKKIFITLKDIQKRFEQAQTKAELKAIKKEKDIFKIASLDLKKSRVSITTFNKAKKAYNAYRKINRLREKYFYFDQFENRQKTAKYYDQLTDEQAEKTNKLLKPFNMRVNWSQWAHISFKDNTTWLSFWFCE